MIATGIKHDTGKAPIDLVDGETILAIADVLAFGAQKYAAHNWRAGIAWSRLYSATMRHLLAFWSGEETDPESAQESLCRAWRRCVVR